MCGRNLYLECDQIVCDYTVTKQGSQLQELVPNFSSDYRWPVQESSVYFWPLASEGGYLDYWLGYPFSPIVFVMLYRLGRLELIPH